MTDMNGWFWFWSLALIMATVIATVILWQGMRTGRAAIRSDRDSDYKRLADASLEVQQRTLRLQEDSAAAIADIKTRLEAVEKMMREVA